MLKAQSVLSLPLISDLTDTDWKVVSLHNPKTKTFTPKATVVGGEFACESKALTNGIVPPIRGSRGIQNLPWPPHGMLSEKTALREPGIGPHRTCQSLALRLPGSRLVKGKFSLLVSHTECYSCYRCSNIRWGRAGGRWGGKHNKRRTILNEVIKRTILFFPREKWRDTVEKKRMCGPVLWAFCKKFPQTRCLWTAEMVSFSDPKSQKFKVKTLSG